EAVRGSLFDPDFLQGALTGTDAVLHLATRIPKPSQMGRRAAWAENDSVRMVGTRVLVDAALASGVNVVVYPSIALVYPERGSGWIDADSAPPRDSDDLTHSSLEAEAELTRFTEAGRHGIVLRLGPLYGPRTPSTDTQLRLARGGLVTVFGPDQAFTPS